MVSNARNNIQRTLEKAWEEYRRKLSDQRFAEAIKGYQAFRQGKVRDAVHHYHKYIRIMEEVKKIPQGELNPKIFNPQKEEAEVFMLCVIFWDLVRAYDRTKGPKAYKLFMEYIGKYVLFSRGFGHQELAIETIRKYISNNKCTHRAEFQQAYRNLGGKDCFVVTVASEFTAEDTVFNLRWYRNEVLNKNQLGRTLIWIYYQVGPVLARLLEKSPKNFRKLIARQFDRLSALIRGWYLS